MELRSGRFARSGRWAIGIAVLALVAAGCGVTRVSGSGTGAQGNDATSRVLGVSDDGRYSLFISDATNLVASDTNAVRDLFRHDTTTGATVRVNVGSNGEQLSGALAGEMSSDGRYVAFITGVAVDPADTNGTADAYVRDLLANTTTWASQPPPGGLPVGSALDTTIAISRGGRFVSFF